VPDIIHKNAADNGMHELFETKVYTAAKTSNNKGGGTARGGGSPSTAAGHFVSFGCTEKKLIVENVGCRARGIASEGPFSCPFSHTTDAVAGCALARGATAMRSSSRGTSCAC
jgi:hypothetical protein